jgi:hypothetical protein
MLGAGFVLSAASLAWLDVSMTSSAPFGALALPLAVSGIGQSLLLVPLIVGVLTTTPAALNGKVAPIVTLCVQLGGSIGSAASIAIFDRRMSFHDETLRGLMSAAHLQTAGLPPTLAIVSRLSQLALQEATTQGFADTLILVGMLALLVAPIVLFFPRSRRMA